MRPLCKLPEIGNKVVLIGDHFNLLHGSIPIGSIGTMVRTDKYGDGIWATTGPVIRFGDKEVLLAYSDIRRATKADFD